MNYIDTNSGLLIEPSDDDGVMEPGRAKLFMPHDLHSYIYRPTRDMWPDPSTRA